MLRDGFIVGVLSIAMLLGSCSRAPSPTSDAVAGAQETPGDIWNRWVERANNPLLKPPPRFEEEILAVFKEKDCFECFKVINLNDAPEPFNTDANRTLLIKYQADTAKTVEQKQWLVERVKFWSHGGQQEPYAHLYTDLHNRFAKEGTPVP